MILNVIPIFNEEKNIDIIYSRMNSVLKSEGFEIVFIDNVVKDISIHIVESIACYNNNVRCNILYKLGYLINEIIIKFESNGSQINIYRIIKGDS